MSPIPRPPSRHPAHPPATVDPRRPRELAEPQDRHAGRAFAIAWAILGTKAAADGAVRRASAARTGARSHLATATSTADLRAAYRPDPRSLNADHVVGR